MQEVIHIDSYFNSAMGKISIESAFLWVILSGAVGVVTWILCKRQRISKSSAVLLSLLLFYLCFTFTITSAVIGELEVAGAFLKNICIFHWFTGTASERRRAIEAGAWFSINPRMLRTKGGQETIKTVPVDRILLETDAPFTMTIESVENLRTELEKLVTGISEIRGEEMLKKIEENSDRVFRLVE